MKPIKISEDEWKVVEERAKTLPEEYGIGIVGKMLNKKELLEEIKNKTPIGEIYVESQIEFLSWLVRRAKPND